MLNDISLPESILTADRYAQNQEQQNLAAEDTLGRDAFLTLFTTQLKNQNPLNPMENEAFVAQLAQFSSLESMKGMQSSIEDLAAEMKFDRFYTGSNFLGRNVAVDSGVVQAGSGEVVNAETSLSNAADSIVFAVYDSQDQLVFRDQSGPRMAGPVEFTWTGVNDAGESVAPGTYRIMASREKNGVFTALPVKTMDTISSIQWDESAKNIVVETRNGHRLSAAELNRIEL
ncbi:MAG: flagellar hook assembly protein FlgD [Pseudohongiellaceae bacterium]